jgi:cytochrome c-type biogenesis protein CcmH
VSVQAGHRVPVPARAAALIRSILGRRSDRLKKILVLVFTVAVMSASSPAYAVQPDEIMADPVKEARARELSRELRCMVCQNQSIDDSEAPLARDLRLLVRERISAGDTDAQVIDFLVARYGEFVLLKPRLEPHTLLLWLLPPLVLAGSGLALWMHGRRSRAPAPEAAVGLTADEEARLASLMAEESSSEKPT